MVGVHPYADETPSEIKQEAKTILDYLNLNTTGVQFYQTFIEDISFSRTLVELNKVTQNNTYLKEFLENLPGNKKERELYLSITKTIIGVEELQFSGIELETSSLNGKINFYQKCGLIDFNNNSMLAKREIERQKRLEDNLS